jgi:hypothetical protein
VRIMFRLDDVGGLDDGESITDEIMAWVKRRRFGMSQSQPKLLNVNAKEEEA